MLQINTSATFAFIGESQLACGTVAGALDENFDSTSQLKIYSTKDKSVAQTWQVNSKFNSLCYSPVKGGVIIGGLENGEVQLFVQNKAEPVFAKQAASGSIKGLDTNRIQPNLFATASRGEDLNIWDVNNLSTPYSPGNRTPKLSGREILNLKWNNSIPHILASSADNGYTVIWDLKNKREVISLQLPGGVNQGGVIGEWHPSIATQIMTASNRDDNPIIMNWDLRNAQQPLYTVQGHQKGILSMSWNAKDPDLLITSAKDLRTIIWDLSTKEAVGELEHSSKWVFQVQWHPLKPWLFGTANYDGKLQVQNLDGDDEHVGSTPNINDSDDPFHNLAANEPATASGIALRRAPQWFRIPVCGAFGNNNQFIHVASKFTIYNEIPFDFIKEASDEAYIKLCKERIDNHFIWYVLESLGENGRQILVNALNSGLATPDFDYKESDVQDTPLEVPAVKVSNKNGTSDLTLQNFLLSGQFHNACRHAIDQNDFTTALTIAGLGSNDLYKSVRLLYLQSLDSQGLNSNEFLLYCIKIRL
eukprot:NODE_497_length_6803_cov_1.267900.p2 type:complete len:533 gc:universal NODE_497_length_6803_cov_1.267900:5199-6797(+)